MAEEVKRERRTRIQVLENDIQKIENQIKACNDRIAELTAKKESLEKELAAEKAKEDEKRTQAEMQDLMKTLRAMGITPGQAKEMLQEKKEPATAEEEKETPITDEEN